MWFGLLRNHDVLGIGCAWWQMKVDVNLTNIFVCIIVVTGLCLYVAWGLSKIGTMGSSCVREFNWRVLKILGILHFVRFDQQSNLFYFELAF